MENEQTLSVATTVAAIYDGVIWFFPKPFICLLQYWICSFKSRPLVGLERKSQL